MTRHYGFIKTKGTKTILSNPMYELLLLKKPTRFELYLKSLKPRVKLKPSSLNEAKIIFNISKEELYNKIRE